LYLLQLVQALKYEPNKSPLAVFLISRCTANAVLANYFYWYLLDSIPSVSKQLLAQLDSQSSLTFKRQRALVDKLEAICQQVQRGTNQARKLEILVDNAIELVNFEALPLPLDPAVQVTGLVIGIILKINTN
jgi:phosphatidylinositol 3-kinase